MQEEAGVRVLLGVICNAEAILRIPRLPPDYSLQRITVFNAVAVEVESVDLARSTRGYSEAVFSLIDLRLPSCLEHPRYENAGAGCNTASVETAGSCHAPPIRAVFPNVCVQREIMAVFRAVAQPSAAIHVAAIKLFVQQHSRARRVREVS